MEQILFEDLKISDNAKKAVQDMGFINTTKIQGLSMPVIMEGRDVIGHSQTGTGKTAAFGIPAIEMVDAESKLTQVLILCPTRELAVQATEELKKFAKYMPKINICTVFGGAPIEKQILQLRRGSQIVVGTPGRVMDHMRRKTLKLNNVKMLILDEADEMLNMGFREDIETICTDINEDRQTILFSATMSDEILRITKQYQKDPVIVKVVKRELTLENISQCYYNVPIGKKTDVLIRLIDINSAKRAMVFCNTKKMVDQLVVSLQTEGYIVEGLHGDMKQAARLNVLERFKTSKINVLVATDVAARGIDVEKIDCVFNYDIPDDEEYYVHRIGRTGRAGNTGASYTLICGRKDLIRLRNIEHYIKVKIEEKEIPSADDIKVVLNNKLKNKILKQIGKDSLKRNENILNELVADGNSIEDIACALLNMSGLCKNFEEIKAVAPRNDIRVLSHNSGRKVDRPRGRDGARDSGRDAGRDRDRDRENMTTLSVDIGRQHKVGVNHILGAFAGETDLSGKSFGGIRLHDTYTTIEVPIDKADMIITKMKQCRINGKMTNTIKFTVNKKPTKSVR